ncbi:MAG: T9SS type A sorting domain-containing protein [Bacteroidota bacterium]
MRKFLIYLLIYMQLCILHCLAQPAIQWEKSLGGTSDDIINGITQTNDGGFIVCGQSRSQDDDVIGNHGNWDAWIVKLNTFGTLQWAKCYGGSYDDNFYSIRQANDGGYICAGYTNSNDGDVSGNHGYDAWIIKINDIGAIQWSKCFGGSSGSSEAHSIIQTSDGNYVFTGYTRANDGDVNGNHDTTGHYWDGWVVKLDSQGTIIWQKCYGGTSLDGFNTIISSSTGGYLLSGFCLSNDGDGCNNHDFGQGDFWIVKIDTIGHIQWSNCFGGNGSDEAVSVMQTLDGGYAIGGYTSTSNNADVMCGYHSWYVLWVTKISDSGSLQWAKCYADTIAIGGFLAPSNDSGFVIIGNSSYWGAWLVKLDVGGNMNWSGRYGSTNGEEDASGIIHCNDGGYAFIASSGGNNHDVTGHHGSPNTNRDYWVVKLAPDTAAGINEIKSSQGVSIYPNPASTSITIHLSTTPQNELLLITDVFGRVVYKENIRANDTQVAVSNWSSGVYFYSLTQGEGAAIRGKFIKE